MSSPVLAITATCSGGAARTRPARKRAAPTPPASATMVRSGGTGRGARDRLALLAQRAQLVLEPRHAIRDRGHVSRPLLPLRPLRIADVVGERGLVGGDAPLEFGDARVERGDRVVDGGRVRGGRRPRLQRPPRGGA